MSIKGDLDIKALILSVSTGQGHNCAASALQEKLIEKGVECRTIDAFFQINKFLGFTVSKGYLLAVNKLSRSYARVYSKLEKRSSSAHSPTLHAFSVLSPKIGEYISSFSPDVIICTHVFAALIVSELKRKNMLSANTIGIVTDFTVHPYWEEVTNLDYIVIPSEHLEWQCIKKGYKKSQILPFGIPLRNSFEKRYEKNTAKAALGFYSDKPLITVISGSMGYGSLSETVKKIDSLQKCFQIAAVCGSNKTEVEKLYRMKTRHKLKGYGYTDKIPLLMDASDYIITKPGGISISEALSRSLPIILNRPILGHEERNSAFLLNCGAAMAVSENCTVEEIIWQLLSDENLKKAISKRAETLGKSNASERLASFILKI